MNLTLLAIAASVHFGILVQGREDKATALPFDKAARELLSATAVVNGMQTVATVFYPDSYLTHKARYPTPAVNSALGRQTEWAQNGQYLPTLDNKNQAVDSPRQHLARKPKPKSKQRDKKRMHIKKLKATVPASLVSTAAAATASQEYSSSGQLGANTIPYGLQTLHSEHDKSIKLYPPSEQLPEPIVSPDATTAISLNSPVDNTATSANSATPYETPDPAYPVTIGEPTTIDSTAAKNQQCTWDGVQINDPVSWTPVDKYKYQPMSNQITSPGNIDSDILAIVKRLTVKEKIGQMTQIQVGQLVDCNGFLNETAVRYWINEWKVGSFLESPGNHNGRYRWYSPQTFADFTDAVQRIALENGPKIPVIWGLDSVRGANYVKGAAMFPAGIGAAATFDPQFAYDAGRIAAKDTRAAGVHWAFAPISDLGVNKLWSRTYENFGEDPYLSSQMTAASVRGYQGNYKHDRTRVAACIKHFIAYGYPFNGEDRADRHVAPHELLEFYVPPFKAAINAGVASAMESYGVVNGEPVVMSHYYLQALLREQLGFRGMLVTDWGEINSQATVYRTARDIRQATWATLDRTSVDMSMVADDASFGEAVLELVSSGALPESRLDESVGRILQLKKDLGLFEQPLADRSLAETVGSAQDIEAARNAVRESVTLLKNENGALPLKDSNKVLFVGPTLNSTRLMGGGWNVHWQGPSDTEGDSVYEGFGDTIVRGVESVTGSAPVYFEGTDIGGTQFIDIGEILEAAALADKIVVGLGENTYAENLGNIGKLALPERQLDLVSQIAAVTDKPIVVVLVQGRPRGLGKAADIASAVVNAYLPGEYGGLPIAEILYGRVNPSGRLPYTYPATEAQASTTVWQPAYSDYSPQWAFGYGLGYSSITYSNVTVSSSELAADLPVTVRVMATNTGPYQQKETAMLFTKQDYRFNQAPENLRLRKFAKVDIPIGASIEIVFELSIDDLAYWDKDLEWRFDADDVTILINPYTETDLLAKVKVLAD